MNTFVKMMKRTYKNKLAAMSLLGLGAVPVIMFNDGTFMLVAIIFGVPLFFSKHNCMY